MSSPIYATAIGLLIHGIDMIEKVPSLRTEEMVEEPKEEVKEVKPSRFAGRLIDSMFIKTKQFFEATPDSEL
jgi:hypothetical protein